MDELNKSISDIQKYIKFWEPPCPWAFEAKTYVLTMISRMCQYYFRGLFSDAMAHAGANRSGITKFLDKARTCVGMLVLTLIMFLILMLLSILAIPVGVVEGAAFMVNKIINILSDTSNSMFPRKNNAAGNKGDSRAQSGLKQEPSHSGTSSLSSDSNEHKNEKGSEGPEQAPSTKKNP